VGRAWLYCNAWPTRGRAEASFTTPSQFQKSV
jgi:hypothetical protein